MRKSWTEACKPHGMMARLYSFATLSDEEEPTKKATIFIAAYAREFEEDLPTDIRRVPFQMHTEPMARAPVRGTAPASEPPPHLRSGVVRCLTPISLAVSLAPFRAEAANEVTLAADASPDLGFVPSRRARVCRAVASALFAGGSLLALYALGLPTTRVLDEAPHVAVFEAASLAHEAPRAKRTTAAPARRRVFASPLPVPPGKHGGLVRLPPF